MGVLCRFDVVINGLAEWGPGLSLGQWLGLGLMELLCGEEGGGGAMVSAVFEGSFHISIRGGIWLGTWIDPKVDINREMKNKGRILRRLIPAEEGSPTVTRPPRVGLHCGR